MYQRKVHKEVGLFWKLCGRNSQWMATGKGYDGSRLWRNVTCVNCLRLKKARSPRKEPC